ncbi:hypothetical protein G647_07156 [Cladophialophora carrionii CBS 160.54]|uniref:AB hydrolase-1 domain-containing protein n=1 Tax=Cladophialophora carrionii CBS 160.54 TaxID=1279043 RepID=V9D1K0_9EURO|nr:uncharacterized protein G647_07156 [Cladophialophora carrionii CBS 160.54]ETI20814.1 hypothetical protein G647_07156 [Cladophialophora carrionii CBS 160.54]
MTATDVVSLLKAKFAAIESAINGDQDFQISASKISSLAFAVASSEPSDAVIFSIQKGVVRVHEGAASDASFALSARPKDWTLFFTEKPPRPHQSYWGILRAFGDQEGVGISGDVAAFGRNARLWRIALDRARDAQNGIETKSFEEIPFEELDELDEEDSIVGRYTWVDLPVWGRSKIFYETAGSGPQDLLLLHTAGADSRQNHSLMNNKQLRERCTMYAFDLPGHGRSLPGSKQSPQGHANSEEPYVAAIAQIIRRLRLRSPVVSGASMAGHVCLALAMRAKEIGVGGVIPLEGCEHIPFTQPSYELAADLNEAVINPERVCGMIAPTAPEYYKRLIWWIYSSQGVDIFAGDLKFYFHGWNGKGRLESIDTKECPVYMLTGEYDYSCTAEMSAETARKIPGAKFEEMKGLGHFPATEDPVAFLPYFTKALDFVVAERRKHRLNGVNGANGH